MVSKSKSPIEHRYFISYPVENEKTAAWFSKKATYSIMSLLWEAGPRGLSPQEVYERLKDEHQEMSRSVVYQTLRGLYENDKVEREWDSSINAKRNVLTERSLPALLDEDFEEWASDSFRQKIEGTLFPTFLKYLNDVVSSAHQGKVPNDFLPREGKDAWCHKCDMSHEAQFFFLGLLYHAAYSFLFSVEDWEFADKELRERIARLYLDNKLADPEELSSGI